MVRLHNTGWGGKRLQRWILSLTDGGGLKKRVRFWDPVGEGADSKGARAPGSGGQGGRGGPRGCRVHPAPGQGRSPKGRQGQRYGQKADSMGAKRLDLVGRGADSYGGGGAIQIGTHNFCLERTTGS